MVTRIEIMFPQNNSRRNHAINSNLGMWPTNNKKAEPYLCFVMRRSRSKVRGTKNKFCVCSISEEESCDKFQTQYEAYAQGKEDPY